MPLPYEYKGELLGLLGRLARRGVDNAANGVGLLANALAHPADTADFFKQELTSFPPLDGARDRRYIEDMTRRALGGRASGDQALDAAMNFAPGPMAGTFIGKNAKTFNQEMADLAQKMKGEGADDLDIWRKTMTWLNKDGPVQEIDDSGAVLKDLRKFNSPYDQAHELGAVLEHPSLYSAYPNSAEMNLYTEQGKRAVYEPWNDSIAMGIDRPLEYGQKRSLLHELQHAIQEREGWARGGSPREGDAYRRLAGEAQARATQSRMNMDMGARRVIPPWMSYDVPLEDLIYRYGGGEVMR